MSTVTESFYQKLYEIRILNEMPFPGDGRNHRNAIANEYDTKSFLEKNAYQIFKYLKKDRYFVTDDFEVEHKGGTKNKADNVIISADGKTVIAISDKQKKKGLGGSFDFTNTSAAIKNMSKTKAASVMNAVVAQSQKDRKLTEKEREKLITFYRKKVSEASHSFLSGLTSSQISDLIKNYLIKPNQDMNVLVTDNSKKKRYLFPFSNHPINLLMKKGYTPHIQMKDGASSGTVIFIKGNDKQDIGLRVRVHTNNGVTALLGLSKSNKNSQFVLKFQQDKIPNLLAKVKALTL